MNCKKNANSNPGEERQLFHPESEKVVEIGLERLRPFKNHPFKVKEDEAMAQLMESIERYGILNPLIVMPTREGVYQIVSGHRRKYCAEKLGYTQVPVIIRYMKEDDSIISMVDSNLHRDKILFSEKAFAYYMKNEAMKRKTGKRRRTQEGQLESIKGTKTIQLIGKETGESPRQVLRYIRLTLLVPELLPSEKAFAYKMKMDAMRRSAGRPSKENEGQNVPYLTTDVIGETEGISGRQVKRYIRLTELIPEILDYLDLKRIPFTSAVEISYLDKEIQKWLFEYIRDNGLVKPKQIALLREACKTGIMTEGKLIAILNDSQPGRTPSTKNLISEKKLRKYFPADYTEEDMRSVIVELLEQWSQGKESE